MKTKNRLFSALAVFAVSLAFLPFQTASANFTGGSFVGGCPLGAGGICESNGNATVAKVAAVLGIDDPSLITLVEKNEEQILDGLLQTDVTGPYSGTFEAAPPITHLVLKASNWFAIFFLTETSGDWTTDPGMWPGLTSAFCPATICGDPGRAYTAADFMKNENLQGISYISGYGVVPIPAALWLFGSALVLLVVGGRRRRVGDSEAAA